MHDPGDPVRNGSIRFHEELVEVDRGQRKGDILVDPEPDHSDYFHREVVDEHGEKTPWEEYDEKGNDNQSPGAYIILKHQNNGRNDVGNYQNNGLHELLEVALIAVERVLACDRVERYLRGVLLATGVELIDEDCSTLNLEIIYLDCLCFL